MTLDPPDEPSDGEPDDSAGEPPVGRLRPVTPGALTACAAAGLVGGWLLHPVAERVQGTAPLVPWLPPLGLFLVAAILGVTARATWRTVHVRREWLEPHRAVNRLVLARSCALVGAFVAGGYFGYAVSWLGVDAGLADQRAQRSAVGGVAGITVVAAAVTLERACRVRSEDDEP